MQTNTSTNHVQDFISKRKGGFQPYNLDTSSQGVSEAQRQTALMSQALQAQMEAMRRKQEEEMLRRQQEEQQQQQQEIPQYLVGSTENAPNMSTENGPVYAENNKQYATSETILPGQAPVTQAFGAYNPGVEVFGSDGRNYGVDFGIKEGTPIALPPGDWEVVDAYGEGKNKGYIGDNTNSGYGNSVLVRNLKTGETMRFSHLSQAKVQSGQKLSGGTVIGLSGMTGNVTGPHLDLEYKVNGQFKDITRSPYANNLFGQGGGGMNTYKRIPMGGGIDEIKSNFKYMGENLKNFAKNIGTGIKNQVNKDLNLMRESQKHGAMIPTGSVIESLADTQMAKDLASKVNIPVPKAISQINPKNIPESLPVGEFIRSMVATNPVVKTGYEKLQRGEQLTEQEKSAMNDASMMLMMGMTTGSKVSNDLSEGAVRKIKQWSSTGIPINDAHTVRMMAKQQLKLPDKIFKKMGLDEMVEQLSILLPENNRSYMVSKAVDDMPNLIKKPAGALDDLAEQARKFDNADDFIKAQGTIAYHGTDAKFDQFDINKIGGNTDTGMFGKGFYFTDKKDYAKTYARKTGNVKEVVLDMKNPYVINSKADIPDINVPNSTLEEMENAPKVYSEMFTDLMKKRGYDGVIDNMGGEKQYVIFDPSKIKIKSKLIDIWNKANATGASDDLFIKNKKVTKS